MTYRIGSSSIAFMCVLSLSACSSSETSISSEVTSPATLAVSGTEHVAVKPSMTVYKSPTCGCCSAWITYVEKAGFVVDAIDSDDVDSVKAENGLTDPSLKSCHTAIVDGYVIEGHVPVSDIERLLAEKPDVVGLTAPGMPMMSPGMGSETPVDYDVLAFDKNGQSTVYSSY